MHGTWRSFWEGGVEGAAGMCHGNIPLHALYLSEREGAQEALIGHRWAMFPMPEGGMAMPQRYGSHCRNGGTERTVLHLPHHHSGRYGGGLKGSGGETTSQKGTGLSRWYVGFGVGVGCGGTVLWVLGGGPVEKPLQFYMKGAAHMGTGCGWTMGPGAGQEASFVCNDDHFGARYFRALRPVLFPWDAWTRDSFNACSRL